jgi:hypothetical protein
MLTLKRLNEPVQQDAAETPVIEADAVLVMVVEGTTVPAAPKTAG